MGAFGEVRAGDPGVDGVGFPEGAWVWAGGGVVGWGEVAASVPGGDGDLIRNRKGSLPHIAVLTAEPLPSRLASIALGTGDVDCVYHFALHELQATVAALGYSDAADMLAVMVDGGRLKDISDLPLDLAV